MILNAHTHTHKLCEEAADREGGLKPQGPRKADSARNVKRRCARPARAPASGIRLLTTAPLPYTRNSHVPPRPAAPTCSFVNIPEFWTRLIFFFFFLLSGPVATRPHFPCWRAPEATMAYVRRAGGAAGSARAARHGHGRAAGAPGGCVRRGTCMWGHCVCGAAACSKRKRTIEI